MLDTSGLSLCMWVLHTKPPPSVVTSPISCWKAPHWINKRAKTGPLSVRSAPRKTAELPETHFEGLQPQTPQTPLLPFYPSTQNPDEVLLNTNSPRNEWGSAYLSRQEPQAQQMVRSRGQCSHGARDLHRLPLRLRAEVAQRV